MRSSTLGTDRAEVDVALLTPVADDGGVAVDALRAHAEWLIEVGVDGLLAAGTTGEGPLLSDEEVLRAVVCFVNRARPESNCRMTDRRRHFSVPFDAE